MKRLPGTRLVELLAQLADVDVHRAVGLAVGLAPDRAVELLAAHDPALALDQRREQLELAGGEVQRPAAGEREVLAGTDLDLPALQLPFVAASTRATVPSAAEIPVMCA